MSIPYSAPKRFVHHRWLSAYDVAISTQRLLSAYKVLYYGFMDKEDKALYKDPLKQLFADYNVSEKAQIQVRYFHEDLRKKGNSSQLFLLGSVIAYLHYGSQRIVSFCKELCYAFDFSRHDAAGKRPEEKGDSEGVA